jgi:hypothetical protein
MRPTRKPRNSPRFTIWRTVSAEQSQRAASISAVKGRGTAIMASPPRDCVRRWSGACRRRCLSRMWCSRKRDWSWGAWWSHLLSGIDKGGGPRPRRTRPHGRRALPAMRAEDERRPRGTPFSSDVWECASCCSPRRESGFGPRCRTCCAAYTRSWIGEKRDSESGAWWDRKRTFPRHCCPQPMHLRLCARATGSVQGVSTGIGSFWPG